MPATLSKTVLFSIQKSNGESGWVQVLLFLFLLISVHSCYVQSQAFSRPSHNLRLPACFFEFWYARSKSTRLKLWLPHCLLIDVCVGQNRRCAHNRCKRSRLPAPPNYTCSDFAVIDVPNLIPFLTFAPGCLFSDSPFHKGAIKSDSSMRKSLFRVSKYRNRFSFFCWFFCLQLRRACSFLSYRINRWNGEILRMWLKSGFLQRNTYVLWRQILYILIPAVAITPPFTSSIILNLLDHECKQQ